MIYTDVVKINSIINHPRVRNGAGALNDEEVADVGPLIESGEAVFLGDEQGGFLYHRREAGLWEVHTQFLPSSRGPKVTILARQSLQFMFMNSDAMVIRTFVEKGNRHALELALAVGFKPFEEQTVRGKEMDVLILNIKDYVRSLCQLS